MANELAPQSSSMDLIMNADMEQVSRQLQAIDNFQIVVQKTLRAEQDFGTIPGTQKPTLLKPGAEKILMLMGLTSEYEIVDKVEDYTNGFFAYTVKSSLLKNGQLVTEGFGSANTKENRYRLNEWSEEEHKKVWTGDYQDPYTLVNTVLKMAKKRAQVDAALTVGSLSNVFTQDVEDMKELLQKETMETMDNNGASSMKVTFGKNKGRTLGEIFKTDRSYVKWLSENAKEEPLKHAAMFLLKSDAKKEIKKTNDKKNEPMTNDQLAEIDLMLDVVTNANGIGIEEYLSKNKLENYKNYSKDQANRFMKFLQDQVPKEDVGQEALFDDMEPPFESEPYTGTLPFDD